MDPKMVVNAYGAVRHAVFLTNLFLHLSGERESRYGSILHLGCPKVKFPQTDGSDVTTSKLCTN